MLKRKYCKQIILGRYFKKKRNFIKISERIKRRAANLAMYIQTINKQVLVATN